MLGKNAVVGFSELHNDEGGRILETGNFRGIMDCGGVCEQATLVSGNKAIIRATAQAQEWQQAMGRLERLDLTSAPSVLRWRRSTHGGQVFA